MGGLPSLITGKDLTLDRPIVDFWRGAERDHAIRDFPHSFPLWTLIMDFHGGLTGRLLAEAQAAPSPSGRVPLLQLIRLAEHWGIPRLARRVMFEMALPRGVSRYQLLVQPRPHSGKSMTSGAMEYTKRRERHVLNRMIASEILVRHEEGKTIEKAVEEIETDETLFPGINFDGLKKRWWEWRRHAERMGGYYHLFREFPDDPEARPIVELIPDLALRLRLGARPLPEKNRPMRKPR